MIALVVTIVVLIILTGVSIHLVLGENGILEKAKTAGEMTDYATAKEKIEIKILAVQTRTYSERQEDATLQELANALREDQEIEYVELETQKVGALNKIEVGDAEKIYTKLKAYPYEFEIGRDLKVIGQKLQNEIPKVAYEGLGYQFIYDGTLQDAGINGKNMCEEITRRMDIQ